MALLTACAAGTESVGPARTAEPAVTAGPAVVVIGTAGNASPEPAATEGGTADAPEKTPEEMIEEAPEETPESTPAPFPSRTTGRMLPGDAVCRPVMVVIGNTPQTRPQTGLLLADVIYELPLERSENITRFLAVFSDTLPASVGPVQSARTYFLAVQREWGGMFVYEGYPEDAAYPAFDESHVAVPANRHEGITEYFYQDKTVSAEPENTLFVRLPGLADALCGDTTYRSSQGFQFQKGVGYAFGKRFEKVGVPFAGSDKNKIEFVYNEADNRLYRYEKNSKGALVASKTRTPNEDGSAFTTEAVSVQNLIIQHVSYGNLTGDYRDANLVGTGKCDYFVNGLHFTGTWKRDSLDAPTAYLLNDDTPLLLEPGSTWIAMQPTTKDIRIRYTAG